MNILDQPHRRHNPLTGEWLLVSPHRTDRPWQGRREAAQQETRPQHDPNCYLCPGNTRANGAVNPDYRNGFAFTNDFAAILPDTPSVESEKSSLRRWESVQGTSRVLCFSPRHDLTLAQMEPADIRSVVDLWAHETHEFGEKYRWVQVFENKGEIMGCSNPHPHGQIWASNSLPNEPAKEESCQQAYMQATGGNLLRDYLAEELEAQDRVVVENDDWVALVPFWAVWPFETMLIPKGPVTRMTELQGPARDSLADILKRLLTRYDNLFEVSFPYTMGWHGAPFDEGNHDHWQLHAHFYPPLLRSATVRKFMVGYEMLAEPQRDISPERAAAHLRELSEIRFDSKAS